MSLITEQFNNSVVQGELRAVCDVLAQEINKGLSNANLKLWYKIPVWFIKDNPVVGYSVTKHKVVNLLFWSGQAFNEPGLKPEGSFKAAEIKYLKPIDIDKEKLQIWLKEANEKIYNYKDIRQNRGKLTLI